MANFKTNNYCNILIYLWLIIIPISFISCTLPELPVYTITAYAGNNGTISPDGLISVVEGDSQTFVITPDTYYKALNVKVDGSSVGAVAVYTFKDITSDHTISVTFVASSFEYIPVDNPNILYTGRFDFSDSGKVFFAWPGVSISALFEGSYCALRLKQIPFIPDNNKYFANYYNVIIDNNEPKKIKATSTDSLFVLAKNIDPGVHTITIHKRTESFCGTGEFLGFKLAKGKRLLEPPPRPERKIEFIGNSITCGYGNESESNKKFSGATENSYLSYAAITARNLNAEYHLICYAGKGVYLNSDSTITNTIPDFYNKICPHDSSTLWDFSSWIPDAIVINLGTNDFGTIAGAPDSLLFISAYADFISEINTNYPEATIFCIDGPMNGYPILDDNGEQTTSVAIMRNYIKKTVENVNLAGIENICSFSMSLIDSSIGIGAEGHPNVYQHTRNANELTEFIKEKMNW